MSAQKKYLNAKDFEDGLAALDTAMGQDVWLAAFAPIRIITAGGFLAVSYLKNRDSTGDIDYLIDPEFVGDKEVQDALHKAILSVARQLQYNNEWINEAMAIFVTKTARQQLFQEAEKQGIVLFKGENLEVLAAPIEWALERKLRRIHAADRDRKAELDMVDAVAFLKHLREQNNGPLDLESIRTMNVNRFDLLPDHRTMQQVADAYRQEHNEEIFK
ncbi:hypothetical protein NUU61_006762 [Penicillium alfredii]|uniref:Uncharacterized protein n=1 Tax=Penicillium alfredii TaxID=1506179 RepID=A0A9W9K4K2_9EURO|nr:uncharacterized protein NUU61_006762 [Penicillium alfredii]KAJ5091892.1 hypothetical protein NUU61_006762 [Penicillium alfredii]